MTIKKPESCNTCKYELGTEDCHYQSLKNKRWLATLNKNGEVIQQCCKQCAQEADEDVASHQSGGSF